jgi:mycofactocin precursor
MEAVPEQAQDQPDDTAVGDDGVAEELLVEEVSIDGMCGVY